MINRDLQNICDILNEAIKLDKLCIDSLFTLTIPCNQEMANHPNIQVRKWHNTAKYTLGFLGLLNGVATEDKFIIAQYDDTDGKINGFELKSKVDCYQKNNESKTTK